MEILDTKRILDYLQEPFVPTIEEWGELNYGICYVNPKTHKERIEVKSFQTISQSFNLLMNVAIKENHSSKQIMLEIAKSHNKRAREQLDTVYDENDFKIDRGGNVVNRLRWGSITMLAGVSSSLYNEMLHKGLLEL